MIGRTHRFHGLGSLRFAYSGGKTVRTQHLSLRYRLNHQRTDYRCAVVVSKKISKSAVVRNRLRRRLYAAVYPLGDQINAPYDLVVTVQGTSAPEVSAEQLTHELNQLFVQAGVLS